MCSHEKVERSLSQEGEKLETGQFVVDILQYKGSSERVIGYRKLQESDLTTPQPIFVLGHNAFEKYKRQRKITKGLEREVSAAFQQIREENPSRGVFLGWRTVMPDGKLPSGPRTAAIYDEKEYLAEVEGFWQFAIEKGFDVEGTEIAFVFHPFIDAGEPPMQKEPFLQWPGGVVTPLSADGQRILIQTTWGPDEAYQGYDHDRYSIQLGRKGNISWEIPIKRQTLMAREGEYVKISIPDFYQTEQVLLFAQLVEIIESYQKVLEKFGPHRLEFIIQVEEGAVFRECVPFNVRAKDLFFLKQELAQPVIVIASEKDIKKATLPSAIVYLPAELYQRRQVASISTLLAAYAKEQDIELVVLSHGSIATQHMVARCRDFEQSVVFAGDKTVEEGDIVKVFRDESGQPQWEIIERKQKIISLQEIDKMQEAAPKARNLSILREYGILTPEGFYISEEFSRQHFTYLELTQEIQKLNSLDGKALQEKCKKIQQRIVNSRLPTILVEEVEGRLKELTDGYFAVRSAERHEDGKISQAGLFESYINITRGEVMQKILECWASAFSYPTIKYLKASGVAPSEIEMAVFIHETVEGKGGVMYTGETIEISAGESPEAITAGSEEKPHQLTVEKNTGKVVEQTIFPERTFLDKQKVRQLVELARQIEIIFGQAQDIEWVIDSKGKIYILQTRPLI